MNGHSVRAAIDELCFEVSFDNQPKPADINRLFQPGGRLFFELLKNRFLDDDGCVKVPFDIEGEDNFKRTPDGRYLVTIKCITDIYTVH